MFLLLFQDSNLNESMLREYEHKLSRYEQQIKILELDGQAKKIEFQKDKEKLQMEMRVSTLIEIRLTSFT